MNRWGPLPAAVAAVIVLAACGSSTTTTVTVTDSATTSSVVTSASASTQSATSLTPTRSSTSSTSVPAPIVHVATFKSPTGNIGCMIIAGTARCDVRNRSWSPPPRPSSCSNIVDFGQGLIVTASGPGHLVCAGDTTLDPTARAIPYGTDTVVGSFRCQSRSTGMTCANTSTGHGFFISFQTYRAF